MKALEGILDHVHRVDMNIIAEGLKPIDDMTKIIQNYTNKILLLFKEYQETGKYSPIESIEASEDCVPNVENLINRSSVKENIQPRESDFVPTTRSRSRRNALKEISQQINEINKPTLKLRRPTNNVDVLKNNQIKTEKLSINETDKLKLEQLEVVKLKAEAPSIRSAPRGKKKNETVQIKQKKMDEPEFKSRDSKVVVQDTVVVVINLEDSADEVDETVIDKPKKRATRTKGAEKKGKRSRTHSSEDEIQGSSKKKAKSCERDEENKSNTRYKEPHSNQEANKDATFISKTANELNTQQNLNVRVVIEKSNLIQNLVSKFVEDMMTDDESEEEKTKKRPKPITAISKATKQIFSPFEQGPVEKKVQAFEKLKEANAMPPRMTRMKTRVKEREREEENTETEPKQFKNNIVKEKAKLFTPISSKCLPLAASTGVKPNRVIPSRSNDSLLSNKSISALKASQAEYREREKKRREKEQDALKKREAFLQAKIQEQKRKREEKQLKAQQQKEALEKEKFKLLEAQKLKYERHKQLLGEQEGKQLKQKEEQEKKRLLAKMRAFEEKQKNGEKKKKEEDRKNEEERRARLQTCKKKPIYMKMKAPLLPTDDCYDSDDDNYGNTTFVAQQWVNTNNLKFMEKCVSAAGEAIKKTFFSIQAQTPDLNDMFENVAKRKLKRTSSAVWDKPPRFSTVSDLESFVEDDETDEWLEFQ